MSIAQIAEAADVDRSTAQRFTYTLAKLGYLTRDEQGKTYSLAPKSLTMGYGYIKSSRLVQHSLQYLLHLSYKIGEGVYLAVLDGPDVVVVQRVASLDMLSNNLPAGTRLPAYCTAGGIAMMSQLPAAEVDMILANSTIEKLSPNTTIDISEIRRRIATAATRGFAVTIEELMPNDISIAAAVADTKGNPKACVTIAVSKLDYTVEEAEEKFGGIVQAAAAAIAQR